MKHWFRTIAAAAALAALPAMAAAQDYPNKPVRVIVPTNAGGSVDSVARVIQRYLEEGKVYLNDDDIMEDILSHLGVYDKNENVPVLDAAARENQAEVHGQQRASFKNYSEVELGLKDTQAVREAERCLRCYRVAMMAV